jgi:hypothetical protein
MIILDTEVYKDYFLLMAMHLGSGKIETFEIYPGHIDIDGIRTLMSRDTTVGFNSLNYDIPIIAAVVKGKTNQEIKDISDSIIVEKKMSWQLGIKIPSSWDHIDLIELAIGQASLKIYGGRLHSPKMQDLPIDPESSINAEQRAQLREYCRNDLEMTAILYRHLEPQIDLRVTMGQQYNADLRSKSDAQIAEVVIGSEIERLGGCAERPFIDKDYSFFYQDPSFISFVGADLNAMFQRILDTEFMLLANGSVEMPDWLKSQRIRIGKAEYQMGIGGLHSCEKRQFIEASSDEILADWDVASYYPNIILDQRLSPKHLGDDFLSVFQSIVTRRLDAKRKGDKVTADVLKIVVNGTFGKLGSKYSFLYSPDLMAQTTITGQLALLMLIERMELSGIRVVSANTDGIVLHAPKALNSKMECVAWDWMLDTSYELERTNYRSIASRDVNNYLAVMMNGKTKGKGIFAAPSLAKNPDCQIVYDAVAARIANGTPIERTIRRCDDIRRFVTVRKVTGGAHWRGENIGKAIRYYYATSVPSEETIRYVKNNNKVPKSEGTRPLMQLPDSFPADVDYEIYLVAAEKLLCEVGYF